ncbi:hypothetical protein CA11_28750 [Gimesia maris]|nr:hypothetical protein CA11_28750 [Gimesia maris]
MILDQRVLRRCICKIYLQAKCAYPLLPLYCRWLVKQAEIAQTNIENAQTLI